MTHKETPPVDRQDVERIAKRDFGDQAGAAMDLLDGYEIAEWESESNRVHLAILKLASGSLDELRRSMEVAKLDYRDVLAWAEYPNQMRATSGARLSAEANAKLVAADRKQYCEWLRG